MGRRLTGWLSGILATALVLAGCGARPSGAPNSTPGFVNNTQHSDAQLWALWNTAQQKLSQQIDINPLEQQVNGAAAQMLPGDARALNVSPRQLTVGAQADVSSTVLLSATGMDRPNPTGLIPCPQPCNVQYAPAYSLYTQPTTRYAESWENSGDNFDMLVEYEFENQILHALGYDLRWR